ncbi:MAG: tyrosine-type recombinase/integrase [Treponema sp.]|nr:tyrosine-type recombinase/integrase [Treponema sp.]
MEVVYFFRSTSSVRVPFFDYDKGLFRLFAVHGGGTWDKLRREFVFTQNTNADQFNRILSGVPYVWVEENSVIPPQVAGFWERPWEQSPAVPVPPPAINYTMLGPSPLPEKFSDDWRIKLEAELRARKYSPRTRSAYIYYNRLLCRTLQKTPEEIQSDDITQFLADMEKKRDYSASAINLALSAIKFFFRNILKNEGISEQHRPRRDGRLPAVFSKEEIKKILSMERNSKHRLLLMLAYSSGLRVSEVVALKREHIDLDRKVIYVRQGKGRKDRCTVLSEKAAQFISEYCSFFGIQTWLFPGQPASRPLTIRSAQHIFDKAVRNAEIPKKISIHSLRHTFATHLLESGTDIRFIQSLLGHANLRTTERYTHVARRSVLSIKSPLDSIL